MTTDLEHENENENDELLQPDESAIGGRLPKGVSAWDQLFKKDEGKLRFGHWPYNELQWTQICRSTKSFSGASEQKVICVARRYIYADYLKSRRSGLGQPRKELQDVVAGIATLRQAIAALSDEAKYHLIQHLPGGPSRHGGPAEPDSLRRARQSAIEHFRRERAPEIVIETVSQIAWSMDRFERMNTEALRVLPEVRLGRPARNHDKWLAWQLRRIFDAEHGGGKQPQGFPVFREACMRPLGFSTKSEKARQDLLSSRKRRN